MKELLFITEPHLNISIWSSKIKGYFQEDAAYWAWLEVQTTCGRLASAHGEKIIYKIGDYFKKKYYLRDEKIFISIIQT